MREILFRGKRIDNNGWVYGHPVADIYGAKYPIIIHSSEYNDRNNVDIDYDFVISGTVGQYTGLTDKNGTKIFEGDIVRYNGEKHIIVFETRGETGYFGIKIDHIETWGFCLSVPAKLMEVIGNIHDNPELAEGLL